MYSLETLLIPAPSNFGFHNTGDKTLVCKRNQYYNLLTANGDDIDKIMAGELRNWGQLKRIPVSELKCHLLGTHTHISIGKWGAWDTSVYTTCRRPCPRSAYSLPDLSLEVTASQNCPKLNSLLRPNVRMAAHLLHLTKQNLYSLDNPISPFCLLARGGRHPWSQFHGWCCYWVWLWCWSAELIRIQFPHRPRGLLRRITQLPPN